MNDYKALREAMAAGPTEGPWRSSGQCGTSGSCLLAQVWGCDGRSLATLDSRATPAEATATASYIAAANPATIRALLAELDALREVVVRIAHNRHMWKSQCENQARQLEALHIATNAKNRLIDTQYEIDTARKDEQ